jgi:hypothetical protein
MPRRWVFAAWLALLAPHLGASAEPITAANWRKHPAIVEIRAIYQETRQAEVAGRLRKEQRTLGDCQHTERALYLNAGGSIRSYHVGGGSEDSAVQIAYYYDRDGALRFAFMQAGAANGTSIEYRVYLSKAGERLWQEQRDLKGPGWTFLDRQSDDWLIKDPKRDFESESECPVDPCLG